MWKPKEPKTMYAYIDGNLLCDVVDEALRLDILATRLKQKIREKYKGHKVEFRIEEMRGK